MSQIKAIIFGNSNSQHNIPTPPITPFSNTTHYTTLQHHPRLYYTTLLLRFKAVTLLLHHPFTTLCSHYTHHTTPKPHHIHTTPPPITLSNTILQHAPTTLTPHHSYTTSHPTHKPPHPHHPGTTFTSHTTTHTHHLYTALTSHTPHPTQVTNSPFDLPQLKSLLPDPSKALLTRENEGEIFNTSGDKDSKHPTLSQRGIIL